MLPAHAIAVDEAPAAEGESRASDTDAAA
jgi:hypothetical protein